VYTHSQHTCHAIAVCEQNDVWFEGWFSCSYTRFKCEQNACYSLSPTLCFGLLLPIEKYRLSCKPLISARVELSSSYLPLGSLYVSSHYYLSHFLVDPLILLYYLILTLMYIAFTRIFASHTDVVKKEREEYTYFLKKGRDEIPTKRELSQVFMQTLVAHITGLHLLL